MEKFKAYRTFEENRKVSSRFVEMSLDELDPGDVVIRTEYSTINYKDALSHNGTGRIMRRFPGVAGIDGAGTVARSADPRLRAGDRVIAHAYDIGVAHDGGYSQYMRVPADWVVAMPPAMTSREAMALGTAGFTAALAIELLERNGLAPGNGPVLVSGATGGVGSVAIEILAKLGHEVVALTGKESERGYLAGLGARDIVARQSVDLAKIKPLDKASWAGGVDNLGGDVLAWMLSTMKVAAPVAAVGLAMDFKLNTTVMPFILRGVALLGADSVNCPMPLRQRLWNRLAAEWRPDKVIATAQTVPFDELPEAFEDLLRGTVRGRRVVEIG